MILSVECAFVQLSFPTRSVVVAFDVRVVRFDQSTKDAAELIGLRVEGTGALWATNPSFQRKVQGLFMSLPVMFCTEGFLGSGSEREGGTLLGMKTTHRENQGQRDMGSENGRARWGDALYKMCIERPSMAHPCRTDHSKPWGRYAFCADDAPSGRRTSQGSLVMVGRRPKQMSPTMVMFRSCQSRNFYKMIEFPLRR